MSNMQNSAFDVVMIGPFPEDIAFIKGGVQASVYGLAKALLNHKNINSVTGISTPVKSASNKKIVAAELDEIAVTYLNTPFKFLMSSALHIPLILKKNKSEKITN